MVSQKKVLSVKIDPDKYDHIKTQAELNHVPMADVILQSLDAHSRNEHLHIQNQELQKRIIDMEKQMEQLGRKPSKSKRLTVTIPQEVYNMVSDTAHQNKMSKSELFRQLFQSKSGKPIPALS